jgi:hypothetical protein
MTKRLPALAIALVASLGFCGVASAASAPLSVKDAKKLARQLAQKQVRGRDVVSYHLLATKRLSPSRIAFAYDDRTASNVYCTATLIVSSTATGRTITTRAAFKGQKCNGIPSDALAVEAATRAAVRDMRGTAVATADSLDRLSKSVKRCSRLSVPRSRRAAVAAILDVALVDALEGPNDTPLTKFVDALKKVSTNNPFLQAGIAGWQDYLAVVRSLPRFSDPCATLQAWAQAGWSAGSSPIDLAAYNALKRRAVSDRKLIARAAKYLAGVGVFPRAVISFTPEGLLLRLAPSLPAGGAKAGKAAVRKPALL